MHCDMRSAPSVSEVSRKETECGESTLGNEAGSSLSRKEGVLSGQRSSWDRSVNSCWNWKWQISTAMFSSREDLPGLARVGAGKVGPEGQMGEGIKGTGKARAAGALWFLCPYGWCPCPEHSPFQVTSCLSFRSHFRCHVFWEPPLTLEPLAHRAPSSGPIRTSYHQHCSCSVVSLICL